MLESTLIAIALAGAAPLISVPASAIEACKDYECLTDVAIAPCFSRRSTAATCNAFIAQLEASPRHEERDFRLAIAACVGRIAETSKIPAEKAALRQRAVAIYERLVAANPKDALALLGWATSVEDEEERFALHRRYLTVAPDDYGVMRLFAQFLDQGNAAQREEGLRYLKEAYRIAPAPHRWYIAVEVNGTLESMQREREAREFVAQFRRDIGFDAA